MPYFFSHGYNSKWKRVLHSSIGVFFFVLSISGSSTIYADSNTATTSGNLSNSNNLNSINNTTNNSNGVVNQQPQQVFRIQQYPSFDNYYISKNQVLYHVIGTPMQADQSFSMGRAPSFMQDGSYYVRDSNHQFYRRDADGDHFVGTFVPDFESLDLRLLSPLQASDIDTFIAQQNPKSPLIGLGQAFIDAQTKYGVNAEYLAAHAILESGYGLSAIAQDKHNLFGYQAYDDNAYGHAAYFPSMKDCINFEAYFVRTQYLDPNGQWYSGASTLDGMNVHYASDPLWAEKIAGIMSKIYPFHLQDYNNLKPLAVIAPKPAGPISNSVQTVLKSTVPMTADGITNDSVNFRDNPSLDSNIYSVLAGGTKLNIIGKADSWYQVKVGTQTGWIYKDYVQLVTASSPNVSINQTPIPASPAIPIQEKPNATTTDSVNFRSGPSTSTSIFTALQSGVPITVVGYQQDWYKVRTNNQTGWIYKDYVNMDQSAPGIAVYIDGILQNYTQQPVIENGRTLVPLRAIFEALGASVTWNQSTQTVAAAKGQTKITLQMGSNIAYVNGKLIQMDVSAHTIHNNTMVPVRFICDALGANVSWDNNTMSVFIQP